MLVIDAFLWLNNAHGQPYYFLDCKDHRIDDE